jgi:hypothetical protein
VIEEKTEERTKERQKRTKFHTTLKKGRKNSIFLVVPKKRERILPKTRVRKGEKANNKNTKDLHHLKSRNESFVVFVAL